MTIDPAGDVQKLQGKWSRVPEGEGWGKAWLVFDGDTATFDPPRLWPQGEKYRFVLNSSIEPKVLRFTHWLGEKESIPLSPTHAEYNMWYKLESDSLTIWNHFAEQQDGGFKYRYHRSGERK